MVDTKARLLWPSWVTLEAVLAIARCSVSSDCEDVCPRPSGESTSSNSAGPLIMARPLAVGPAESRHLPYGGELGVVYGTFQVVPTSEFERMGALKVSQPRRRREGGPAAPLSLRWAAGRRPADFGLITVWLNAGLLRFEPSRERRSRAGQGEFVSEIKTLA